MQSYRSELRFLPILLSLFFICRVSGQVDAPHVNFEVSHTSLGSISNAGTLISKFTFKNTGDAVLYILRTDHEGKVKIDLPQRGIEPDDTGSLIVYYSPDRKGKFHEKILVYTNASGKPAVLTLSGDIKSLSASPQECYSFVLDNSSQNRRPMCEGSVINKETKLPIAVAKVYIYSSNQLVGRTTTLNGDFSLALNLGLYDFIATAEGYDTVYLYESYFNKNSPRLIFELSQRKSKQEPPPVVVKDPEVPKDSTPVAVIDKPADTADTRNRPGLLSYDDYKPNNVVFLIDISSSMQGKERLPLLKLSIQKMISQLRDIDKVTVITYSGTAKVMVATTTADHKEEIYLAIDTLRAAGMTAGSKGLDLAYKMAAQSFIKDANNQIILATDGAFTLKGKDERTIRRYANSSSKKITLTTIGFGTNRTDLKTLETLALSGKGNYIYINNRESAETAILDEIKNNSRR
jgi:Ca-activated chloride channel family protein